MLFGHRPAAQADQASRSGSSCDFVTRSLRGSFHDSDVTGQDDHRDAPLAHRMLHGGLQDMRHFVTDVNPINLAALVNAAAAHPAPFRHRAFRRLELPRVRVRSHQGHCRRPLGLERSDSASVARARESRDVGARETAQAQPLVPAYRPHPPS